MNKRGVEKIEWSERGRKRREWLQLERIMHRSLLDWTFLCKPRMQILIIYRLLRSCSCPIYLPLYIVSKIDIFSPCLFIIISFITMFNIIFLFKVSPLSCTHPYFLLYSYSPFLSSSHKSAFEVTSSTPFTTGYWETCRGKATTAERETMPHCYWYDVTTLLPSWIYLLFFNLYHIAKIWLKLGLF